MIEIKNIEKSFGENKVLKNVNMTFKKGQTNLIIGESGSGKTTLIKILIGLYKNYSGKVLFDGSNVSEMNKKELKKLRQDIGMLFQNIIFPLSLFTDKSEKEKMERVNFCLERVNLKGKNNLMPSELSGGMKKRVAIARAIVMQPKYLFCDEPNSGLDPKTAILIDDLIMEITKEYNITTIVNTHDMNSVMQIGDNISFIHKGEMWWKGNKEELIVSNNEELTNFVFASKLFKRLKK
jgi:phospholipid/cholesterol/gamma-HCH transport system ATP-binding protein